MFCFQCFYYFREEKTNPNVDSTREWAFDKPLWGYSSVRICFVTRWWFWLTSFSGADPGFPLGGGANPPGGAPTCNLAKFSEKLLETRKMLGHGGCAGSAPLDPPLVLPNSSEDWFQKQLACHKPNTQECTAVPVDSSVPQMQWQIQDFRERGKILPSTTWKWKSLDPEGSSFLQTTVVHYDYSE